VKVIADHPPAEMYATGLEIDCQCARCGSSVYSERCDYCEDGFIFDTGPASGPDYYAELCPECDGNPVSHYCLSSPEWCQANPLPGREHVERGQLEWLTLE
jgi:hypothetical protein